MKRRVNHRLVQGTVGAAIGVLALSTAQAQEALRAAQAARNAASNRSNLAQTSGYRQNQGSAFQYTLGASLGFEYNDNVNLSDNNAEDDFSIRPRVSAGVNWAITQFNTLGLDISLGYNYYLNESRRSALDFNISPDADNNIGFEILLGDWSLYLYDNFSVRSDPIRDGSVNDTDKLVEFRNVLGLQAAYQWVNASYFAGYAYQTSLFQSSQRSNDRDAHLFNTGYQYMFNPALIVGASASASMSVYRNGRQNDNVIYSVGPFVQWRATQFISISASGGPAFSTYSRNNAGFKPEDRTSYYGNVEISHQLTENIRHRLSVSKSISPEARSFAAESLMFSYDMDLNIFQKTTFTLGAFFQDGESTVSAPVPVNPGDPAAGTPIKSDYNRVGFRMSASRRLGENLSAALNYQHTARDGKSINSDYSQNRVSLSVRYEF